MNGICYKTTRFILLLIAVGFFAGCEQQTKSQGTSTNLAPKIDLGPTIGSLAQVVGPQEVVVEGYGLVGGLPGTGSSQCPPQIRAYLKRYISTQLPDSRVDADKLIDSDSTAVVWLEAIIPPEVPQRHRFDVMVVALSGTQTTSLEGGWLYTAELWPRGTFAVGKVVATAEGPVFIDTLSTSEQNKRIGYVLGGGKAISEYIATVLLHKPDYRTAGAIRDKINERFGFGIAKAISPGQIELNVPQHYRGQELKFVEIIRATYLGETPEFTKQRIKTFITKLAISDDKHDSEIALEAIGKESLSKLVVLLNSSDQQVCLIAARCMLNLGSDRGLATLAKIAKDPNSPFRVEALQALSISSNRTDVVEITTTLLSDRNLAVVIAAYEQLRKLNDPMITQEFIGRSFLIDHVPQAPRKAIFVARSGQPRIVLFGAPIYCHGDFLVQSKDGSITIDRRPGQENVSITRKHPARSTIIGPIITTLELTDIIKTLCEEPAKIEQGRRRGLGVSYPEMIALVKQMCEKDIVTAEFWGGPLPRIASAVKK